MMLMKPMGVPGLALAGLVARADAGAQCPELERLHGAFSAARDRAPIPKGPGNSESCGYDYRVFLAAKAWIEYAHQNAESCGISGELVQMEREYRDVARTRDNICSGRPARPFPVEVPIPR
jgi:hypothetical protein